MTGRLEALHVAHSRFDMPIDRGRLCGTRGRDAVVLEFGLRDRVVVGDLACVPEDIAVLKKICDASTRWSSSMLLAQMSSTFRQNTLSDDRMSRMRANWHCRQEPRQVEQDPATAPRAHARRPDAVQELCSRRQR